MKRRAKPGAAGRDEVTTGPHTPPRAKCRSDLVALGAGDASRLVRWTELVFEATVAGTHTAHDATSTTPRRRSASTEPAR
jgi:hypothetical protein